MMTLAAQHPGRILSRTFMRSLKIDVPTLHLMTGLPSYHLRELLLGRRDMDRRTAFLLGESLGTGPEFWLEAQQEYETEAREHDIRNTGVSRLLFGFQSRNGGSQQ